MLHYLGGMSGLKIVHLCQNDKDNFISLWHYLIVLDSALGAYLEGNSLDQAIPGATHTDLLCRI